MNTDLDRPRLESAKVAVGTTFAFNGPAYAGWLARGPAAAEQYRQGWERCLGRLPDYLA